MGLCVAECNTHFAISKKKFNYIKLILFVVFKYKRF